ncbi:hypothetical protein B0H16DRAFT_1469693 [Mycena metata]|uniref:Uncharacterized protein n=1 Tax=Mycena metata TaxID=1033252 RepID=A0AAD7HYP8_9AGAR|nr:hypothetical protein B0H16DRAFT_1469693 [Mycena metata]
MEQWLNAFWEHCEENGRRAHKHIDTLRCVTRPTESASMSPRTPLTSHVLVGKTSTPMPSATDRCTDGHAASIAPTTSRQLAYRRRGPTQLRRRALFGGHRYRTRATQGRGYGKGSTKREKEETGGENTNASPFWVRGRLERKGKKSARTPHPTSTRPAWTRAAQRPEGRVVRPDWRAAPPHPWARVGAGKKKRARRRTEGGAMQMQCTHIFPCAWRRRPMCRGRAAYKREMWTTRHPTDSTTASALFPCASTRRAVRATRSVVRSCTRRLYEHQFKAINIEGNEWGKGKEDTYVHTADSTRRARHHT